MDQTNRYWISIDSSKKRAKADELGIMIQIPLKNSLDFKKNIDNRLKLNAHLNTLH